MSRNSTFIKIKLLDKYILAYIDTGATICLAQEKLLPIKYWKKLKKPIPVRIANNKLIYIQHKALNFVILIEGRKFLLPSIYKQETGVPLILGNNFLKLHAPFIQKLDTVTIRCPNLENQKSHLVTTKIYNTSSFVKGEILHKILTIIGSNLETQVLSLLDQICSHDALDPEKNKNNMEVKIELLDPNKEINVPNRIPYTERDVEEFTKETSHMLEKGIIRNSTSPHSAPAFYVENHNEIKRGRRRMVINYKEMNKATKGDAYKLPRQDYIFTKIRKNNWFSTLDAKSGYYQLRLHEDTKALTAFTCPPQNQYEFNVLPFGLKQAPSIYQRFMDTNLLGLESICLAYIDDIIIFTNGSREKHLINLYNVLNRLKEKGVILSKEKAKICQKEIEFLGMKILENGFIETQKHLLEKIELFPDQLSDRKQIQRFLGCLNYIGEKGFIKNLSKHRNILQKMISEKVPWKWTTKATEEVRTLKGLCKKLPKLYLPKPSDLLILNTDASIDTWSAVLQAIPNAYEEFKQFITNNKPSQLRAWLKNYEIKGFDTKRNDSNTLEHLNKESTAKCILLSKWASGTFKPAEINYTVHEKETLALIKALEKFRIDLQPVKFIYQTDSSYTRDFVKYKLKEGYNKGRLLRWSLKAQQFDFIAVHIKGEENYLADTLTREWRH